MARTRKYKDFLLEQLQDPEEAAAYLNAALEDEDPRVFLVALRNIAGARGGMSKLSDETKLSRGTLYRTLSTQGNSRLSSLRSVLNTFGLEIHIDTASSRVGRRAQP